MASKSRRSATKRPANTELVAQYQDLLKRQSQRSFTYVLTIAGAAVAAGIATLGAAALVADSIDRASAVATIVGATLSLGLSGLAIFREWRESSNRLTEAQLRLAAALILQGQEHQTRRVLEVGAFLDSWNQIEQDIHQLYAKAYGLEGGEQNRPPIGIELGELTRDGHIPQEIALQIRPVLNARNSVVHFDRSEVDLASVLSDSRRLEQDLARLAHGSPSAA